MYSENNLEQYYCNIKQLPHNVNNLPTKILDFRGLDSSIILICKGWNSQAHREIPGKLELSNLSRETLSREIGRMAHRPPFRARPLSVTNSGVTHAAR